MRTSLKLAVPALVVGLLVGPGVNVAAADDEPCAGQQVKVAKAEDALARVTAVFERQKVKVHEAEQELAAADNKGQKMKAAKALAVAQDKKARAHDTKRAQKMRLQKAQERLDTCLATEEPADG
jgi:hypothetical protein